MAKQPSSRIAGFYNMTLDERLEVLAQQMDVDPDVLQVFKRVGGIEAEQADHMIENVIGVFGLPLGIATNFIINGRELFIPMVIEEPSVVAGASFMAKLVRDGGGFHTSSTAPEMIGQIQVLDVPDPDLAADQLMAARQTILDEANLADPLLIRLGGGARELEVRILRDTPTGTMLIVHLIYDTRDAMGANAVNSAVERVREKIESITRGRVHLRILSNLADRRRAQATCTVPLKALAFEGFSGEQVRDGIVDAWSFAASDPYRAATHNKGIMNGVDAVVIATGNDWRAIEAGAHAYAARSGHYSSLSRWGVDQDGNLTGSLDMPMAVGTVGGATRVHPMAKACLAIMGVERARDLAEIIVSVGLAQNLAALRALASEGIQRGHMALHARQIAIAAGAEGRMIEQIADRMVREKSIGIEQAQSILETFKGSLQV
ncbi:MAG: hydroxymethylglutaryl-CoA reductase, degradative [Anaerolineales bacterium]|nr:MAG: hydroxymethylglutaryl-CoA reductase, degradative [Anaerolineales bacterium]